QKPNHRSKSEVDAQLGVRTVVEKEHGQAGNGHRRDAVKDAAMHGDVLEYLRHTIAHENVNSGHDHDQLFKGEIQVDQPAEHQKRNHYRPQSEQFADGHAAVAVQV